ncbi:unnamed protein product [Rhodiola kirilowii]
MKDMEAEFNNASVAKRTRAGFDRYLVAKLYGESGSRNRRKIRRVPDVKLVTDEVEVVRESEEDAPPVRVEGCSARKGRGKKSKRASKRGKECAVDVPNFVLVSSPSVKDDHSDEDCWFVDQEAVSKLRENSEKCGLEEKCIRKGKEKMVVDDVVDRTVASLLGESESVRDNDESNGRGKNKGCKDVGDSAGSRTGFRSPNKANVDSEETRSVGCSRTSVHESDGVGDDRISSEEESETEVSSTESEDDDSDENYDEKMADMRTTSESLSDSDTETGEEEFFACHRGANASCGGKPDENVSPCSSSDVVFLGETDSQCGADSSSKHFSHVERSMKKEFEGVVGVSLSRQNEEEEEILGADSSFNGNGSCIEPHLKESAEPKGMDEVCLSAPYKVEILGKKVTSKGKSCCTETAPFGTKEVLNKTKIDDSVRNVSEENSNYSKNELVKCFQQGQKSAKNKPKLEATFDWDEGTVRKRPSQRSTSFVKPAAPSVVRSVPHKTYTNGRNGNSDNKFPNKVVSKVMTDHGRDKLQKENSLGGLMVSENGDDEKEQQEERLVLQEGICRKPYSKKRVTTLDKISVFDILLNSLADKGDAVHKDVGYATDLTQEEKQAEPVAPKSSLPQLFTFGVEKPVQVEKSEYEQELDNLWDEYQFAIRTSEIGCLAQETVKTNNDTTAMINKIFPTLCKPMEHKFILDDEIGIRCRLCSFVQLEIEYITPDWAIPSSRKFDRRAPSDDEDPEMFDRMQFDKAGAGESSSCSDGTVWDLIPGVKDKLFPHQQDGFEFIWSNLMGSINLDELRSSTNHGMGGCIISHAPGTGKTRLTMEFLLSYLELFPRSCPLIIVPSGMLLSWEAEFRKWDVGIPFHNLNSKFLSGKEDIAALKIFHASKQSSNTNMLRLLKLHSWKKQKSILGISYSLFEKLAGQGFGEGKKSKSSNKDILEATQQAKEFGRIILEHAGLVVLDEGHTPRNPRSRICKALTNIQTRKRVILSGTPFQNNLAELYTILSFVRPDFAQTISPELKKFCLRRVRMVNTCSGRHGSEADVARDDREAILQLRCTIDPFVHVHKGSVLLESLPGLMDCVIVLNPQQYQKEIVETIESNSYTNFEFEHKLSLGTIHPSLLLTEKAESFIDTAELEACKLDPNKGVKTRFLFEMIRLSEANKEKVLVFSQYLDPLGLIKDQLCSLLHWHEGEEVIQLDGSLEQEQRQKIINEFNDPGSSAKVLLASTKACSEGISLVGASRVVLLDVVWNPSVERQAISRAFRLGQKKVVYSYNLIVGHMEWEKYCAQTSKDHVSTLVFCSNDEPEKRYRVLKEDKILNELITHSSTADMFDSDKIIYYPKDKMFG